MADLTVSLRPALASFALSAGEERVIQATASEDGASYAWTLNGNDLSTENNVTAKGDGGIGHYVVTATVGDRKASAEVEVTLAPEEKPAVWNKDFAIVAASVVGGLVLVLSIPGYAIAFRAVLGKDNAAQVVGMFLVLPGLLALGVGSFLLLLDYRGRMLSSSAPREVRQAVNGFALPGGVIEAVSAAIGTFTKATRGAAGLIFAAVAIFGFAAWAAVGGDADPSESSQTPSPTPSPSAPASPAPSGTP